MATPSGLSKAAKPATKSLMSGYVRKHVVGDYEVRLATLGSQTRSEIVAEEILHNIDAFCSARPLRLRRKAPLHNKECPEPEHTATGNRRLQRFRLPGFAIASPKRSTIAAT